MPRQNSDYAAPGALVGPAPVPTTILLVEAGSLGSVERVTIRRVSGPTLFEVKTFAWQAGKLGVLQWAEMEATLIDQFRLGILAAYGIQAELWGALEAPTGP